MTSPSTWVTAGLLSFRSSVWAVWRLSTWPVSMCGSAGLWHGKQLAVTVAVLAVLVALACFWLAHFIQMTSPTDGAD